MKSRDATIAIIVAIIGVCGVLGAALINNWDKLFPSPTQYIPPPTYSQPTDKPSDNPTEPVFTCGGTEVNGFCWYHGEDNLSCTDVCSSHGGYNLATSTYAGTEGNKENCLNLLYALNIPLDEFYETTQGGLGCFTIQTTSGNYFGYWDEHLTEAFATSGTPGRRRICACQQ